MFRNAVALQERLSLRTLRRGLFLATRGELPTHEAVRYRVSSNLGANGIDDFQSE